MTDKELKEKAVDLMNLFLSFCDDCFHILSNNYQKGGWVSITFVYRDENNKVQVKKIDYEEVKKDLMKYLSHDIRSIIKEKEKDETASNI